MLAFDLAAQEDYGKRLGVGRVPDRQFFKLRDPASGEWTAFFVKVPGPLSYPTWSPDGRFIYAHCSLPRSIVRFDLETRRLETVANIEGLGESGLWMSLDPSGAPLFHRDVSQREIVVMDWEGK
jgi:hypothetical protein